MTSTDFELVLSLIDDLTVREQVRARYFAEIGQATNRVQNEVFRIGQNVNDKLDAMTAWQRETFGGAIEHVDRLAEEMRAITVASAAVVAEFHQGLELMSELRVDIDAIRLIVAAHDLDIKKLIIGWQRLEDGRVMNVAAIANLGKAITEVRDEAREYGTASRKQYNELANQVERLSGMVQTVLPILSEIPADRLEKLAAMIRDHERMLRDEYNAEDNHELRITALEDQSDGNKS